MPRPTRFGLAVVIALLVAAAAGCAQSEKSRYARHLAAVVEPGPALHDDVAIAFGLDGFSPPAVAAVTDE